MQDVNDMVRAPGNDLGKFAWTVAAATAGNYAHRWVDSICPGSGRSLTATFVLSAVAAACIGFALAGCIRTSAKAVLFAAGGTGGSISAVTAGVATATPALSVTTLAAFFVGAVTGLLLGMFVALYVTSSQRAERC
jgi:hypothetical protein